MELDFTKLSGIVPVKPSIETALHKEQIKIKHQREITQKKGHQITLEKESRRKSITQAKNDQYMKKVLKIPSVLNRKLKYSVNKELNQVVVKVIDAETDRVIRVIPEEALLKLHTRMKEIIGLVFDEKI